MNPFENKDFEKNIQQSFEEAKIMPSARVWNNLEAKLQEKNKKKGLFFRWWYLNFVVIALVGIGAVVYVVNKKSIAKEEVAAKIESAHGGEKLKIKDLKTEENGAEIKKNQELINSNNKEAGNSEKINKNEEPTITDKTNDNKSKATAPEQAPINKRVDDTKIKGGNKKSDKKAEDTKNFFAKTGKKEKKISEKNERADNENNSITTENSITAEQTIHQKIKNKKTRNSKHETRNNIETKAKTNESTAPGAGGIGSTHVTKANTALPKLTKNHGAPLYAFSSLESKLPPAPFVLDSVSRFNKDFDFTSLSLGKSKFWVGPYYAQHLNYRKYQGLSSTTNELQNWLYNTYKDASANTFKGYSIGIKAGYYLTNKLCFVTGLSYNKRGEVIANNSLFVSTQKYKNYYDSTSLIYSESIADGSDVYSISSQNSGFYGALNNPNSVIYSNIISSDSGEIFIDSTWVTYERVTEETSLFERPGGTGKSEHIYKQLEIPVYVQYTLFGNHFKLNVGAGICLNYLYKATSKLTYYDNNSPVKAVIQYTDQSYEYRRTTLSFISNIDAEYKFDSRYSITLSPNFKYSLMSITGHKQSQIKVYPFSMGLELGVRRYF